MRLSKVKILAILLASLLISVALIGCSQSVPSHGIENKGDLALATLTRTYVGNGSNNVVANVEYEYDSAGNLIKVRYPDDGFTYEYKYNDKGAPTIYDDKMVASEIEYDSSGRVASFELQDGDEDDEGFEVRTYEFKYDNEGNIVETLEQWDTYDVGGLTKGDIVECVRMVTEYNAEGYPIKETPREVHWNGTEDSDKRLHHASESLMHIGRYEGDVPDEDQLDILYDYSMSEGKVVGISKTWRYYGGYDRDAGDDISTYDVTYSEDSSVEISGEDIVERYTYKPVETNNDFAKAFNKLKRFIVDLP